MKLHWIFNRYMNPAEAGVGGGGGGGGGDRGDDFTPTGDDAKSVKNAQKEPSLDELDGGKGGGSDDDDDKDDKDDAGKDGDAGKDDKTRKDSRIPLARHKEILQREREQRLVLEQQLAKYQQSGEVADANKEIDAGEKKLSDLEDRYEQLLADGKTAEAKSVRTEMRALERDLANARAQLTASVTQARAIEQVRYDMTLERLEAAYPAINQDSEDFDEGKMKEVLRLQRAFVRDGETPSKALQDAVKYVFPPESSAQRKATDVKPRVDTDDPKVVAEQKRRQEALKRNVEAAGKQPPKNTTVGVDHDKAGGKLTAERVMSMNQDEFAKLAEADLAALRGDEIEA